MPRSDFDDDYARMAALIGYLDRHAERQPELDLLADVAGLSPDHLRRLFQRWAGVTPKRLLQHLTVTRAKPRLRAGAAVLEVSAERGLSGPSRLHDHFVTLEAMTPGEYARGGAGLVIEYGVGPTPYGAALVATTARGICALEFLSGKPLGSGDPGPEQHLAAQWPQARRRRDDARARALLVAAFNGAPQRLHVPASNFQVQVWRALLDVPEGEALSYGALAARLGLRSPRAVGQALASNRIAWLIPCHRVLRSLGGLGGYRWGPERKRLMLWREALRADASGPSGGLAEPKTPAAPRAPAPR
jgi:AraC family transcriptional regulator of adaptative response/methylated-DNA-[protein]-cysteine methyltransferase